MKGHNREGRLGNQRKSRKKKGKGGDYRTRVTRHCCALSPLRQFFSCVFLTPRVVIRPPVSAAARSRRWSVLAENRSDPSAGKKGQTRRRLTA